MNIIEIDTVAFTASRELTAGAHDRLHGVLRRIQARTYVTGACIGGDQAIATLVAEMWPAAQQRIVVPRDRSRVDMEWLSAFTHPNVTTVFMPPGTTYRDRNLALLGEEFLGVPPVVPDLLIGFPRLPAEHPWSRRSGTWMTLRMAQAKTIRRLIYVLP